MIKYEITNQFSTCTDWIIGVEGKKDLKTWNHLPINIPNISTKDFSGEAGTVFIVNTPEHRFLFLGLGENLHFSSFHKIFRQFTFTQKEKLNEKTGLVLFIEDTNSSNIPRLYEAAWQGILEGTTSIGLWKSVKQPTHIWNSENAYLYIFATESLSENIKESIHRSNIIHRAKQNTSRLINTPSNFLNPQTFAIEIENIGKEAGFEVEIFTAAQLKEKGLNALLGVGQGSETPPIMAYLNYNHNKEKGKHIGLVGKGITFDTGGISIKSSTNMHFMKSDMSGAAAILGTFQAVAMLGLPIKLTGFLPIAENAIGSSAIRPGDILNSYSGKTIEIIDTDAEGRLILADALSYLVKNYSPDKIVNMATLTGSVVGTLGHHAAGLFSNNDELAQQLYEVGKSCGENLWRLPLFDAVKEDLKSDVADLRNYSGLPTSGAISAAKFLEEFIDNHPVWAHLDIAGVAFEKSEMTNMKSATGYGVRLLTEWIINQ